MEASDCLVRLQATCDTSGNVPRMGGLCSGDRCGGCERCRKSAEIPHAGRRGLREQ